MLSIRLSAKFLIPNNTALTNNTVVGVKKAGFCATKAITILTITATTAKPTDITKRPSVVLKKSFISSRSFHIIN